MIDLNPFKTMSEKPALDELQGFLEKEIPMYLGFINMARTG